jgi:LacI family transcriptional regulator
MVASDGARMVDRPTIADLAKAAGVSVATVDRVLNRRLPVRGDTSERVVLAAEQIGFHAAGLLRRRAREAPPRRFGFLLQKRNDPFYQSFGERLARETKASQLVQGRPVLEFADELVPATIADRLTSLAQRTDAVAVVTVDHPIVNEAVEAITRQGKPVFTLLSDVTTPARTAYLAADSRKAGRTAAWIISRMAKRPGKVGILVGTHRYLSQDMAEISFRSYFREHVDDMQLLEPVINLDDNQLGYEAVSDLLARNRDITGIYALGGGRDGFLQALRDEGVAGRVVAVCNELTNTTRSGLIDGTLALALGTPISPISQRLVELMAVATGAASGEVPGQALFAADLHIRESI